MLIYLSITEGKAPREGQLQYHELIDECKDADTFHDRTVLQRMTEAPLPFNI